jgi:hypothetical protein
MPYVRRDFEIVISPLVCDESGVCSNVSIIPLDEEDKEFAYNILRYCSTKDCALSYKKGRKVKNAGEAETLALAKRFEVPIVLHDKLACNWARTYRVSLIKLVDLPDNLRNVPNESLIEFYGRLCRQRSSDKACEKFARLTSKHIH